MILKKSDIYLLDEESDVNMIVIDDRWMVKIFYQVVQYLYYY